MGHLPLWLCLRTAIPHSFALILVKKENYHESVYVITIWQF